MSSNELVKVALHILNDWINGSHPADADVDILRRSARPGESDLPVDELACLIVRRECQREIHSSRTDRKAAERLTHAAAG